MTMKHNYFVGNRIRLRAMEPEDLSLIYDIENDPQQWYISNFTVPYSRYVMKQYMENTQYNIYTDKQLRLIIVGRDDDVPVGIIDVTEFMPMHARAEVGIVIKEEFRGLGYAKEALELICDYAFCYLHLRQLTAHVVSDNEPSMRLFTSCGFVRCGLLKDWLFVEGVYKDVALLQRIFTD